MKRVLVIDIGGTHVKLMISRTQRRKFDSGPELGPRQLVAEVKQLADDWKFDLIAIGFPAPVQHGVIVADPKHLAAGWKAFDFKKAFEKPVRIVNDAALQALGSYHGGRMLFLGLGTGLGSALVWEKNVLSLELSELPYDSASTIEDQLGKEGLKRLGRKQWAGEMANIIARLKSAMIADYVVLGGGNAKVLEKLPDSAELGHNRNVYLGGTRLWQKHGLTRRDRWNIF